MKRHLKRQHEYAKGATRAHEKAVQICFITLCRKSVLFEISLMQLQEVNGLCFVQTYRNTTQCRAFVYDFAE